MEKRLLFILIYLAPLLGFSQSIERIKIASITPSENTGQDYSPWLNDDLNSLVKSAWTGNFKWVDVTLKLEKRSKITKLSLYDYEGSFESTPVSIYALDGTNKVLLGTFKGLSYKVFVDIIATTSVEADAIIIRKYANAIPQKVQIYGIPTTTTSTAIAQVVVQDTTSSTPAPIQSIPTTVASRVKLTTITPSENTGQNYTPWLNDDLTNLVTSVWGSNMKWVDIKIGLEKRTKITKLSLYDYEGSFADNPATIYGLDGSNKILLGKFEGLAYKAFVDIVVASPIDIDAIIIHKYTNNIPQKIQVYGLNATSVSSGADSTFVVTPTPTPTPTPAPTPTPVIVGNKIAINAKRWYQLNNVSNSLEPLFDGVSSTAVLPSWGKILSNYDAYYPLLDDEQITLQSIRFFDGQGIYQDQPMTLSVITDTWERIQIAKFTGTLYGEWVGPDPANTSNYVLSNIPTGKIRYLVINTYGNFPTEIELYGTHTPCTLR
eukprot:Opistho-2@46661